jgi:hypothetical protein
MCKIYSVMLVFKYYDDVNVRELGLFYLHVPLPQRATMMSVTVLLQPNLLLRI